MTYPSGLTPEEFACCREAMRSPISAGAVISQFGVTFRVLEDTTAHGCPLVEFIEPTPDSSYKPGDRTHVTLYQHFEIAERLIRKLCTKAKE